MGRIRVFVMDDHKLVREGIIYLLKELNTSIHFAGSASDGKEGFDKITSMDKPDKPEVVLMDINMPEMNGIECTALLTKHYPEIKVIALTMLKNSSHIKRMLKEGAVGYLLKDCDRLELKRAIHAVHEGETYFSPAVAQEIMNHMTRLKKDKDTTANLSSRELEVLNLVVADNSNQEIADDLNISVRTVETHKQNLLAKTGTKSVAGLVVYAIKNDLVDIY
ncbi:response regulator transcription factor [Gramella sp. BOM4]|nr:response regulator transcription factor [Christiangramia bathymodioli]